MSAPKRIWATVNGMSTRLPDGVRQLVGGWSQDPTRSGVTEYVRADLYAALEAQLAEVRTKLQERADWHKCSCPHPCDDYNVFPGGCAGKYRQDYMSILSALEAAAPEGQQPVAEALELSGNTGELIEKMAEAIRGDTASGDTPWATLSEDRKIGWRGDAERALAVVKEYLTALPPRRTGGYAGTTRRYLLGSGAGGDGQP